MLGRGVEAELAGTARPVCPPGTEIDAVWHSCY